MKKTYLCVLLVCLTLFGASAAHSGAPSAPPIKFQLLIVDDKEAGSFNELNRRVARHNKEDEAMRINKNITLGQIKQPSDSDRTNFHRGQSGFGLRGKWHF